MEESGSNAVGSIFPSKDPGWKYFTTVRPDNKNDLKCNFCGNIFRGGIYRAKQHIAGGYRNATSCQKCPSFVRQEIKNYMKKKMEKAYHSVMSDLKNVSSQKKRMREGTTDMNDEARDVGEKRTQNTSEIDKEELRENVCMSIARWMYDAGIPFEAVNYPSFQEMLDVICQCGRGFEPPTCEEIGGPYLRKEVAHIEDNYIKPCRDEWVKHGCSVMVDCWTDENERTLINFFVNSREGSVFFESINASEIANTEEKMCALIDKFVEGVGEENVVQVVTNNPSKMVLAGKMLEVKRPHLYWTPCAVHCIDLMLEDIGKLSKFKSTLKKAISVTSYIYDHLGVEKILRQFAGYEELSETGPTRFSTFVALEWMLKSKHNLLKMFISKDWTEGKFSKDADGKKVVKIILTPEFWEDVLYTLKIYSPLVCVLRLVDGKRKNAMGYIYEALDRAKKTIMKSFEDEEEYKKVFEIIDSRWKSQLHQPLHSAGYFLNPQFFSSNKWEDDGEVNYGFLRVLDRLVRNPSDQDKIIHELTKYRKAEGVFGLNIVIRQRARLPPTVWWENYGSGTPHLQKFAIKVLSLTCSSPSYEHDWDIFDNVHSRKGNSLVQKRTNDLLFVRYNRALKREIDDDRGRTISLKEIDECNEWLVGSMNGENELVPNSSAKPCKDPKQGEMGKCVKGSSLRLRNEEEENYEDEEECFEEEEEYVDEDMQFYDEDDDEDESCSSC